MNTDHTVIRPSAVNGYMKRTPLHHLLQLAVIFMCSNSGDESRAETPPKEPAVTGKSQESTEALAKKISASRANSNGSGAGALLEMHQLMKQWSPVGLAKEKVIELLGKPSSINDQGMIYRFDHGDGGWQWEFDLEKGLVSKVRPVSLE